MGAFKKGCLEFLVVWGVSGFALYTYFIQFFDEEGVRIAGIAGGFLLSSSWGLIRNVFFANSRSDLLKRAKSGMMPVDGELFVAHGKIRPVREPLRTPFQKKECIAHGYSVFTIIHSRASSSDTSSSTYKETYLAGFACCPSVVRGSAVNMKIMGFPLPDSFPEDSLPASQFLNEIREHGETVPEQKGIPFKDIFSHVKGMFSEDDGTYAHHWKTDKFEHGITNPKAKITEQYIPVGADICIIGTYSATKGGLISNLSQGGMEVFVGGIDDALKSFRWRKVFYTFMAIVLAAIATAGAYGILSARELRDSDLLDRKRKTLETAIAQGETAVAAQVLGRGLSANSPEIIEQISEKVPTESLKVLLAHGLDLNRHNKYGSTPLQSAVYQGDRERAELLLSLGSHPNTLQREWGTTALELAFDRGDRELVKLLTEKGGKGTFVTAKTGIAIPPDGGEEFRTILQFIQAQTDGDLGVLEKITDRWPDSFFESAEQGMFRETQLKGPKFERGFSNDDASTVIVSGRGGSEVWIYTLVKKNGSWKVRRTAWDREGLWQIQKQ